MNPLSIIYSNEHVCISSFSETFLWQHGGTDQCSILQASAPLRPTGQGTHTWQHRRGDKRVREYWVHRGHAAATGIRPLPVETDSETTRAKVKLYTIFHQNVHSHVKFAFVSTSGAILCVCVSATIDLFWEKMMLAMTTTTIILLMLMILSFRSSELCVDVLRCMHMVLHRTEVRRWEMFSDMFNSLCILVSNPTGQGRWSYKRGSVICSFVF